MNKLKFLTQEQVESLIDSIPAVGERNLRDRAIIQVLWTTGLRLAELLSLPEAPFAREGLKSLELSIVGKMQWRRMIYFSPATIKMIKAYLAERESDSLELFD